MGAWIEIVVGFKGEQWQGVAPLVGAWIEISSILACFSLSSSHPSWVRGLKLSKYGVLTTEFQVAPLVGAWIEIRLSF